MRRAIVELVAESGLHGASMSKVAEHAGVATGTAYVHYDSKDDLLIAAFVEVKRQMGEAALAGLDLDAGPRAAFESAWRNIHSHLSADPDLARFLIQMEGSPLRVRAHEALLGDDPLTETARALAGALVDLPIEILYDLGIAPAVRLVASGTDLDDQQMATLVEACWRSIAR